MLSSESWFARSVYESACGIGESHGRRDAADGSGMAIKPALGSATHGFVERGRTLQAAQVIDIAAMSHRPDIRQLADSVDGITHLDVVVANGPFGPEVLVTPRAGDRLLPSELYAQVPGAFGAPAAFDRTGGHALAWASPSGDLQEYLQTHLFGAPALPGGLRNGVDEIDLEWTIQISALSVSSSLVVCQLSGTEPAVVEVALSAIDRLSKVTSQSQAAGPQGGLHAFRFGFIVELALTGKLDALFYRLRRPPRSAPSAPTATPLAPVPVETFEPEVFYPEAFDSSSFHDSVSILDSDSILDTFSAEDAELDSEALFDMSATSWEGSAGGAGPIDARARVAEALGRYEGKRVAVGVIADQKKLTNVLRGIAPDIEAEDMCGYVDTGARANGKSGAVFTTTAVHFTGLSGRQQYDYAAIESFELEASAVILNGVDGTRAKISTSGQSLAIAEAVAAATGLSV